MCRKKRRYWPVHVNCDCASYEMAKTFRPGNGGVFGGLRCEMCGKILGCMQWGLIMEKPVSLMAESELDAIRIALDRAKKERQNKS